jgi:hypothetical protein
MYVRTVRGCRLPPAIAIVRLGSTIRMVVSATLNGPKLEPRCGLDGDWGAEVPVGAAAAGEAVAIPRAAVARPIPRRRPR